MPSIAEIRAQYPQYDDMTDSQLADALYGKFYSDMPREQFDAKIGMMPQQPEQTQPGGDPYDRSTLLPISRNRETGDIDFTVPGLVKGIYESGKAAVTAPGRAMSGDLQVMGPDGHATPEAIQEGLNMAVWATPAPAARYKYAPATKPAAVKPEGLAVAEAATRQGIDMPMAAVSDKVAVQQAGKTLANVPVAGTPLRKASSKAIGQLDDAARSVEQGYGTGSVSGAGSMVRSDVTEFAKTVLPEKVRARYDAVDDLVQHDVVTPLSRTQQVAGDIIARRQNAMMKGESGAVRLIEDAARSPQGLNYKGLKDLRTSVGEMLEGNPDKLTGSNISHGELKRIYGALTEDLQNAVQRSGGEKALSAFKDANAFAAKTAAEKKSLQKILGLNRSDEGIFDSLQKMAGSTSRADITTLAKARRAVSKETWDETASAVLSRMGRDADGKFSPDRFLTAFGKLSPSGKAMLFNTTGKKGLAKSLDDIAEVSRRFKQLNQYANPSGTSQSIFSGGIIGALLTEPFAAVTGVSSGRVMAQILARPATAEKVAQWAKAYEQAALKPTPASRALLENRTKALAVAVASERGLAAPVLNNASKAIADPKDADPRREDEVEGEGPSQYDPYTI